MRCASSCYPDETKETLLECRGGINIDVMLTHISGNSHDLKFTATFTVFSGKYWADKTYLYICSYIFLPPKFKFGIKKRLRLLFSH